MTSPYVPPAEVTVGPDAALWAGKMIARTIEPIEPELAQIECAKERSRIRAEYHKSKATYSFAVRGLANLHAAMETFEKTGERAKMYVAAITAAIIYYDERRFELKSRQKTAHEAVVEFEQNFTGGYVLGTLVALMAKPLFLLLQILGLWALFGAYIPWMTGKTAAPEGGNPTVWVIVFQVAAGVFAAVIAFIFRGILMKIRMTKLARKKDQMTALANYRMYDGMLRLVIATALAANKAYGDLTGEQKMSEESLHAFWDDVVDCDDGRREFAERAGVTLTEVGEVATSLGMTGEEDTLFEALVDILTN